MDAREKPRKSTYILHPGTTDLLSEDLMTPSEVAAIAGMPTYRAIIYWMERGLVDYAGERFYLECIRTGKRRKTSKQAVQRFMRRANAIEVVHEWT